MAPKKKGKGKGKKGPKLTPEEQAELEEAEADKLERDKLYVELDGDTLALNAEKESFNEFQQQREKLNYFWIVEKKRLDDKKSDFRNKVRELEDLQEKHAVEIKVYKQRVKHLLYEHQNETTHLKTEAETTLKLLEDEDRSAASELKKDKRSLHIDLKEMELAHEDYLKSMKQEQDKNITYLRQEFERKAKEIQDKYEKQMKDAREDLDGKRKKEIVRIEQQKDRHIKDLMKTHEQAFAEIKNYYTDITHNNLDLIKSLKEEVAQMKKEEVADEKMMYEISLENKRMSEPLKKAIVDVTELREELANYKRDKELLRRTKSEILVYEQKLRTVDWEHEVLFQRFGRVEKERDELYKRFQAAIYDVQQKSGFKNLLLEKRIAAIGGEVEKKDAQLNEILANANLSPAVLGKMNKKMDDILEAKNQSIRDLQQELERLAKMQNDAVRLYEAKLAEYGIASEELGFVARTEKLSLQEVL